MRESRSPQDVVKRSRASPSTQMFLRSKIPSSLSSSTPFDMAMHHGGLCLPEHDIPVLLEELSDTQVKCSFVPATFLLLLMLQYVV